MHSCHNNQRPLTDMAQRAGMSSAACYRLPHPFHQRNTHTHPCQVRGLRNCVLSRPSTPMPGFDLALSRQSILVRHSTGSLHLAQDPLRYLSL